MKKVVTYFDSEKTHISSIDWVTTTNKKTGIRRTWHGNGKIAEISRWKEGKKHGRYEFWNDDGIRVAVNYFKNGILHGKYMEWNDIGYHITETNYIDGRLNGLCMIKCDLNLNYYIDGRLKVDIKRCYHGWKVLTMLITKKKNQRVRRRINKRKDYLCDLNIIVFDTIMEYIDTNEKISLLHQLA